jgi:hypothetical protein
LYEIRLYLRERLLFHRGLERDSNWRGMGLLLYNLRLAGHLLMMKVVIIWSNLLQIFV